MSCVHFLAIMNNAAMNIWVQVFVWTYVSFVLGHIPRSRLAGLYGNTTDCFVKCLRHFTFPSVVGFQFLHILTNTCYYLSFGLQSSYWIKSAISLWFWFAFPWWLMMLRIFSYSWPFVCLLWRTIWSNFLPIS